MQRAVSPFPPLSLSPCLYLFSVFTFVLRLEGFNHMYTEEERGGDSSDSLFS